MDNKILFHLNIKKDIDVHYAILPGDPGRVDKIAAYIDSPVLLASNREFRSVLGSIDGEKVIITSTGIGGPSAAIALEELYKIGVKNIIRIGTCGAMQQNIVPGDVIIPTAAVRMEGTSREYAPIEFPAAADHDMVCALVSSAKQLGLTYHTGIVQSKDSFYGQHCPETMPVSYELKQKWQAWIDLGVLASEMETAALFTVAHTRRIRAGCILHALWNQERKAAGKCDPVDFDLDVTIRAAVNALKAIIGDDNGK